MKKIILKFFIILVVLSSCTPLHKLKYIQETDTGTQTTETPKNNAPTYNVQVGDKLYIDIKTSIPEMANFFGSTEKNQVANVQPGNMYLTSLIVSDSGFIELPLLGKFNVVGKTIAQIQQEIQNKSKIYINDAVVSVKMVNFSVTLLGEVLRPGQYYVYNDKINILEAIGLAGDLTVYGNREKITVTRKNPDGTYGVHYININKKDLIAQEFFFLQPNDIVYIEPLKAKSWGFSAVPLATILSSVSTLILILNFINVK